jgi:hypothetical protein
VFDSLESSTVSINSDNLKIENLRTTGDNFFPWTTVSEKENTYTDQAIIVNTQRRDALRPKQIINYKEFHLLAKK